MWSVNWLDIDATALLPGDDAGHGFDNVTLGDLSPTLLDRYISAAQKISRLAVGSPARSAGGETFRVRPDLTQEEHVEGLPSGTRGGVLLPHTFPRDGEYEIQVRLTRDRNEEIEGLHEAHELEAILDRAAVARFTVAPPVGHRDFERVDGHLKARVRVAAGPHRVGVTFLKLPSRLLETGRQPYQARFNMHRHPRRAPAVYQVSIHGPLDPSEPGDTPSRRRIFEVHPATLSPADEERCAEQIVGTLMRRACRRPMTAGDLAGPLGFYRRARDEAGFEAGIETALTAVLMHPEFLFRGQWILANLLGAPPPPPPPDVPALDDNTVPHPKSPAPPDLPARGRRHRRPPAPRSDGSGRHTVLPGLLTRSLNLTLQRVLVRIPILILILILIGPCAMTAAPMPTAPLADAAERLDHATVRALLDRHADVQAPQPDGMTALELALHRSVPPPRHP